MSSRTCERDSRGFFCWPLGERGRRVPVHDKSDLGQRRQCGVFDSGNVDEYFLAAVTTRNEALSLHGIEPFDYALLHRGFLSLMVDRRDTALRAHN